MQKVRKKMEIEHKIDREIVSKLSDCKFVGIVGRTAQNNSSLILRVNQHWDGVPDTQKS